MRNERPSVQGTSITDPEYDVDLRRVAEEILRHKALPHGGAPDPKELPRLLHELQLHQVELEMQNEDLREAQAELELTLNRYTALYDFAPIAYFSLDTRGAISQLNRAGARLLGADRADLVRRRFADFVALESRSMFVELLDRSFQSRCLETCRVELAFEDPNAGRTLVHLRVEPDPQADGFHASATEISATHRAHEPLTLLSRAVEQAPLAIVLTDADGNVVYANAAATASSGGGNRETRIGSALVAPVCGPDGRVTHYLSVTDDGTDRAGPASAAAKI